MHVGRQLFSVGVSAGNVFSTDTPPQLVQQLLEARLQTELNRKTQPYVSESDVARDWTLLQETMIANEKIAREKTASESGVPLTARAAP